MEPELEGGRGDKMSEAQADASSIIPPTMTDVTIQRGSIQTDSLARFLKDESTLSINSRGGTDSTTVNTG